MTAKEYYCKKWDVTQPHAWGLECIEFAEEYHQAKSKEEAEERYEKAKSSMNKVLRSSFIDDELKCLIDGHLIFASGKDES